MIDIYRVDEEQTRLDPMSRSEAHEVIQDIFRQGYYRHSWFSDGTYVILPLHRIASIFVDTVEAAEEWGE